MARLAELDSRLLAVAREALEPQARVELARRADEEIDPFRDTLTPEALARARAASLDRLVREWFALPTVTFG